MKKLYRKGSVHPTPSIVSDHLLSFLPAVMLALTVALSPSDKEVLAYLISSSSATNSTHQRKRSDDHAPSFSCSCFGCYMSYWVRWDTSPNRQLIHEIIDAYEDSLLKKEKRPRANGAGGKKDKRKGKNVKTNGNLLTDAVVGLKEEGTSDVVVLVSNKEECLGEEAVNTEDVGLAADEKEDDSVAAAAPSPDEAKGSVRRFVSFVGERIWSGVWG